MSYSSPKWNNGSAPPLSAENMQALTDAVQEQGETLETMCNPNMLDNWYFVNPVNQRGQTSYTRGGYGIDRWRIGSSGTLAVQNGYITFSSNDGTGRNLEETLETIPAGAYTLSALVENGAGSRLIAGANGTYYGADVSDDSKQVVSVMFTKTTANPVTVYLQCPNKAVSWFAVKLELGSQQTLAHQDANGNWELNEIPNYGEQLRRCQRYYQVIQQYSAYPAAIDVNGNLLVAIVLPVEMRIRPAFSRANMNSNIIDAYFATGGRTGVATTPAVGGSSGFANLNFQTIAGKTNMGVIARFVDKCFLSADL